MAILSKKQTNHCSTGCFIGKWVSAVLLLIVALAALMGVYETHIITSETAGMGLQFGSTGGSLAILAFTVAVVSFGRQMVCCMSKNCEVCS